MGARTVLPDPSLLADGLRLLPHAVLDVVVDDEVQFLVREAVVLREQVAEIVAQRFTWRPIRERG